MQKDKKRIYSSDATLDELLSGGFHEDLVYLLFGDNPRVLSYVLMKTAVNSFRDSDYSRKVAWVDGDNQFNPYKVSKQAARLRLSPRNVLESILIARAFTYDQMIEICENRISQLEDKIKILFISGLTKMFPNHELPSFEELQRAINGIKTAVHELKPLIVLTAPQHEVSQVKPKGGHNLTHFSHVLVKINQTERYREYMLVQHPSLPENRLVKWLPSTPKRRPPPKNMKLDHWLK